MRILFLLFFISLPIFSMNIGVVDFEYVFIQYNKRIQAEVELEEKRVALNNEIENLRKTLLVEEKQIRTKSNLTKKDEITLSNLKKQYQEKIQTSEKEFQEEISKTIYDIRFEINSAAILIGQEKKLDMVMEKNVTVYGGMDITEDVLLFLNTSDSYKLDTKKILKKQF